MTTRIAAAATAAILGIVMLAPLGAQDAGGITMLCSNGIKAVMVELVPQFERSTKQRVTVAYDLAANIKRRIEKGEPYDVAVVTPAIADDLIAQGRMAAGSRTILARSGLGVAIRAGGHRADISTPDAFKRALLNAKGVAFAREGASGVMFQQVLQKLAIANQVKLMPTASGEAVGEAVVGGSAEFAILPVSEIVPVKGAELLGTFPGDLQNFIVMAAGVNASSTQAKTAARLIDFVMAPAANATLEKYGMVRPPK